jgi:hypothetical protein
MLMALASLEIRRRCPKRTQGRGWGTTLILDYITDFFESLKILQLTYYGKNYK